CLVVRAKWGLECGVQRSNKRTVCFLWRGGGTRRRETIYQLFQIIYNRFNAPIKSCRS
ncbi:uncharacterized protein MYCFIDRAFT_208555, partial [Pseudocercospora fijiensis CIRAD86]